MQLERPVSLYASRPCWQTAATVRTVSNRRLQRGRLMGQAVGDSVGSSAGFTKLRRRFVQLSEQSGNPASNLRVLQFNTLADGLAQNGDFIAVPAEVLEWRNRAAPLLAEILEADADIIALQEVNHYDDFLQPELEARGYRGAFFAKCSSPAAGYGYSADGCALFYRQERFEAVAEPEALCFRTATGEEESQGMLQLRLCDRRTGTVFIVATTHLKAKSGAKNEAIRQRQAQQVVDRLADSVAQQSQPSNGAAPVRGDSGSSSSGGASAPAAEPAVLLCGDFNAEPQSAELQVVARHALELRSLWDERIADRPSLDGKADEQLFTTWKIRTDGQSRRVIDYIWYTQLQPIQRWLTPPVEEIGPAALPCRAYPSDHVAVCCEFQLASRATLS